MSTGSALGITNLRQLFTFRLHGYVDDLLLDDIRQIHIAARQLFHGVLGKRFIDPATLEKMIWSLERQVEAGQDLQAQLVGRDATEETQAELADLIAYFEVVHRTLAGRLGAQKPAVRPQQH
jgi:hypothetical protein